MFVTRESGRREMIPGEMSSGGARVGSEFILTGGVLRLGTN